MPHAGVEKGDAAKLSQRAMAGNAPRHRRQRRDFRICKLQNPLDAEKFESHSLRQTNVAKFLGISSENDESRFLVAISGSTRS